MNSHYFATAIQSLILPPFFDDLFVLKSLQTERVLDFSDCGTPGKETTKGKSSAAPGFSSPSSYLLKGCR